mgnify:CR=1 FL=1|tara:strand:+ start:1530 stop:1898 length:369 start_codon:yes stop_codon:yes gene_type:complete
MKLTKSRLKQLIREEWQAASAEGMEVGEELPLAKKDSSYIKRMRDEVKKAYIDELGQLLSRETDEPLKGHQFDKWVQALTITQGKDARIGGPSISQDASDAQTKLHHTTDTDPSYAQIAYEE